MTYAVRPHRTIGRFGTFLAVLAAAACVAGSPDEQEARDDRDATDGGGTPSPLAASCAPDDGGISVPAGFCAFVAHEGVGLARELDVRADGDVFVAIRDRRTREGPTEPGGVIALRDADADGVYETEQRWGGIGTSEALLHDGALYVAPDDAVLRYELSPGSLTPASGPDTLGHGLPDAPSHASKSVAVGADGALYVNIGAPSNACMRERRTPGSSGLDPCPDLERRGGIWRFDAEALHQAQDDGTRFATGLRNVVALDVHPATGQLYGVQHGRDQLRDLFPGMYTQEESAELPSEELFAVDEGDDFGWPYCYHDWQRDMKLLGPEYGGDKETIGRCADAEDPLVAFPGHWAPNDLTFYGSSTQFPGRYRNGAFVAFHGSWNRAPLPQEGYNVAFVPFRDGRPTGEWEVFADGFRPEDVDLRSMSVGRPVGVAVTPDGSLLVIDSLQGRIWRIVWRGS